MCSFYARSVKMSFRIKICYSETAIEKLLSVNSERTYFTLVKCST